MKKYCIILLGSLFLLGCLEDRPTPSLLKSLLNISNEPPGENCEAGGLRIEVWVDENENDTLELSEIIDTEFICDGKDGTDGVDGHDGGIGTDGLISLIATSPESPGSNCENSGIKIESGVDSNANGMLDEDEVSSTSYVCDGSITGILINRLTVEPAGDNCEFGGKKVESGNDQNGDHTLNENEITSILYLCDDGNVSPEENDDILFPETGLYGLNLLDPKKTSYAGRLFSLNAQLPQGKNLKVKLSGVRYFYEGTSKAGWFVTTFNDADSSQVWESKGPIYADVQITFVEAGQSPRGGYTLEVKVWENSDSEATWSKTIHID